MANRFGRPRDLSKIGTVHGRLTISEPVMKDGKPAWLCSCLCGNTHVVKAADLRNTKSCGCLRREFSRDQHTTHGLTKSKSYQAWRKAISRCTREKDAAYHNYGGRGISVCERWNRFENFLDDMGHPPDGYTLDRINNDGNYAPENCRWATVKTQANNKRTNVVMDGFTIAQAAEKSGHSIQVIHWRINKLGMTMKEAMETPKMRNRRVRNNLATQA